MPETGDPTLDQLRVLVAIAETGSFSAAARCLGRAQSVISYTISQLEAQLGVVLFDRAGRTPRLTEPGQALLADARRVGLMVDGMRARAVSLQRGLEASVSIAVDVLFPMPMLVATLRAFAAQYPSVSLALRIEALGGVVQAVTSGQSGLGVSGWMGGAGASLARKTIGTLQLIPVAAPTHPLAGMAEISGLTAREHTQLVLSDRSDLTSGQDYGVLSPHSWRLSDLGARHALLLAGLGWCNMPTHLVAEDLAQGRLVRLNLTERPEFAYPISLLHRLDHPPGPATAWLAARLEAALGGARDGD